MTRGAESRRRGRVGRAGLGVQVRGEPSIRALRFAIVVPVFVLLCGSPLSLAAQDPAARGAGDAAGTGGAAALVGRDGAQRFYQVRDDLEVWRAAAVLISQPGSVRYWVDDAAGSLVWEESSPGLRVKGRRPGAAGLLVGFSELEADPQAARAAARRSAVRQIVALVLWRLRDRLVATSSIDFEDAVQLVSAAVESSTGRAQVEVFEQSVDRPYGRLHRAAVLVKADEKSLESLAAATLRAFAEHETAAAAARRVLYWKGGIATLLTVLAAVAYAVLNALTQGYFTWRLRALSLLALAAAYALVAVFEWPSW